MKFSALMVCLFAVGLIGCSSQGGASREKQSSPATEVTKTSASGGYLLLFVTTRHAKDAHHDEDKGGNRELYLMDTEGQNQMRLTNLEANDTEPGWSPDGKRIVFASNRDGNDEIYSVELGRKKPTRLTDNKAIDCQPVWSPDGKHIAFVSDREKGNWDIYVMDADGKNVKRMTSGPGTEAYPAWSPDGKRLVFIQNPPDDKEYKRWQVMMIDAKTGKNRKVLTPQESGYSSPVWHPDGKHVLYMSMKNGTQENPEDIYMLNVDTLKEVRLTDAPGSEDFPCVSPDGKYLAFMHASYTKDGEEVHDIYRMEMKTREWKRLTVTSGNDFYPRWSPKPVSIEYIVPAKK